MKKQFALILAALAFALTCAPATFARGHGSYRSSGSYHARSYRSSGVVHVRSYTRRDGTFVHAHDRTRANGTQYDNWSTKGNTNPETGKAGTVTPTH